MKCPKCGHGFTPTLESEQAPRFAEGERVRITGHQNPEVIGKAGTVYARRFLNGAWLYGIEIEHNGKPTLTSVSSDTAIVEAS